MSMQKLIFVLKNPGDFAWNFALYLPEEKWTLETPAMVLDPDDVDNPDDPDDDPQAAKDAGFKYALMMQDVDSIFANAKAQKGNLSDPEILSSFLYYVNNDAFIAF